MRAMSQNADGHEFDMSPMADNADDTVERVSLIDHDEGPTDIIFSRKSDDVSLWDTFKVTLRDARGRSIAAFVIFLVFTVTFSLVGTLTFWADSMTWKSWFTLFTVICMMSSLVLELWDVSLSFFAANLFLLLAGVISIQEALAGFSSESIISIGTMYIIAAGIEKTKLLDWLVRNVLRRPTSLRSALVRVLPPIAFLSAWVNNTPIVAVMIPVLGAWSIKAKLAVSRLLMPMSFSVTLGGLLTIIGTSTNLVVQALAGPNVPLGFFQIGALGAPFTVLGVTYVLICAPFLLPREGDEKEYIPCVYAWHVVPLGSKYVGQTVSNSTIAQVSGAELMWVKAADSELAVSVPDLKAPLEDPQEAHLPILSRVIQPGDMLLFIGVKECVHDITDLTLLQSDNRLGKLAFFEVYLPKEFPLSPVKHFGQMFGCRVRLVFRHGFSKHQEKNVVGGDVLLVESRYDILHFNTDGRFGQVKEVPAVVPHIHHPTLPLIRKLHPWIALVVLLSVVVLNAVGLLLLYEATGLGTLVLLMTGVLNWSDVLNAVPGNILLMTAFSFSLAAAMTNSGIATLLGQSLAIAFSAGPYVQLLGIYIAANALTAIASNAAAAAIMYPIVVKLAQSGTISLYAGLYTIMIAASADFLTPFGVETNLMVKAPGGYKFGHYTKFGLPLTLLGIALTPALASVIWPVVPINLLVNGTNVTNTTA